MVPPLALVVALRRRRIRVVQRASRDADAALASEATEVLRNVRVVQAFTRERRGRRAASPGAAASAVRAALGAMDLEARWSPVADLLLAAGGGLVLWLGVTAVTSGRMTLGTLLVVLAYLSSLYGPIRALARLARTLARGAASRERILEVLDSGEVVPEAAEPLPAGPPRHGLALRGVWFAYAEGARSCATWTSRWPPASGSASSGRPAPASRPCSPCCCGSTTPTPARSSWTGPTCATWSWARSGASSPWSPRTRGCWTAPSPTTSASGGPAPASEELEAAARSTGLDELIQRLPDGWDTQIGEGGVRLSGGQRRRVALARAILARRLGAAAGRADQRAGRRLRAGGARRPRPGRPRGGRSLSVSHRLSLAARADRVVVLDGGRVVEQGPPGELLAAGGAYARLWALQHPDGARIDRQTPERG